MTRRRFLHLGATAALTAGVAGSSGILAACAGNSHDTSAQTTAADVENITFAATENEDGSLTQTIFAFDTVVTVTAWCDQSLLDEIVERCAYFDDTLSPFIAGTDLANINAAGGEPVEVHDTTADLIAKALVYCEKSDGKLDITIGAVSLLWDFVEGVKPDDAVIQAALPHIDYHLVEVDGNTVTLLDPEAKIDLGAVAKGYIADDLAQILHDGGCESAFIDLGGNVYVIGAKPDGSPWNIGVQDPNDNRGTVIGSVHVENQSVVTSGLYERVFEEGGVQYYHILDPKTGYPVETDLVSSSIVSAKSLDGDAYSTILFLEGSEGALETVEATPEIEAILIDRDGKVLESAGAEFELL